MKLWPFTRERRADATDLLIELLQQNAAGEPVTAATAAIEGAAGLWGRAFAAARPLPEGSVAAEVLTPAVLYNLGRALCQQGRYVAEIRMAGGALVLDQPRSYTVTGDGPEDEWEYELSFARPSSTVTRHLSAGRVVDVRLGQGLEYAGPMQGADTTASLSRALERRLEQEAGGPAGYLLPVPAGQKAQLAADIKALRGRLGLVETTAEGFGAGATAAPRADYEARRVGFTPPPQLRELRESVERSLFAAAGVPILTSQQDGTAQREQLRRMLHSTIQPVADIAAVELAGKLATPGLALDFAGLYAADISGRARAFAQLVQAGLPIPDAQAVAGVLAPGED